MAVTESWLTRRYSQPNIGLTGAIWVCVQGFAYAVIELLDQSQ